MISRPTHQPAPPWLSPANLNMWFALKYNGRHPNYADDCQRACAGTVLSWERMFLLAAVRSDRFTKSGVDLFGTGYEGADISEQLTNAVAVWEATSDMGDLRLSEADLQTFDALWAKWAIAREALEMSNPLPPPPPPPKPPEPPEPPKPAPAPVEPVKPEEPKPEKPGTNWKKILIPVVIVAVGLLIKAFAPGWVGVIWDAIAGAIGG